MSETTKQPLGIDEQLLKPFSYGAFSNEVTDTSVWSYASYDIHLPEAVLVEGDPDEPISIGVNLEEYDAEVQLTLNPRLGRVKKTSDGRWYYPVNEIQVTIAHNGDLAEGDDHQLAEKMLADFEQAAIDASNRLVTFLRCRLWSSLFESISRFEEAYGEDGSGLDDLSLQARFSIRRDVAGEDDPMQLYLQEQFSDELAESFLAMAQQSIMGKRMRCACLELSMACESFVKRRISHAYHLSDAIDDGFKSRHQAAYIDLNGLFQARDEAGNAGKHGFFSVTSEAKRNEIHDNLMLWGASVTCLKQWLGSVDVLPESH